MGYGKLLKLDHDFVGRSALEAMAGKRTRQRVTLIWNSEDVARVYASLFGSGLPHKMLNLPAANYGFRQYDEVRSRDGKQIGLASIHCYSSNERQVLALATVEPEYAVPGTEVMLVWGEADGGTRKPHVERHAQTEIRAIVAPAPYATATREMKSALKP
jgi:glycine cleavage system aminomethyltransferase T